MARKSQIGLRHYIHKEAGSVMEQAEAIHEYYLPGSTLYITLFGKRSWSIPAFNLTILVIGESCLCTLLHEIGHAKLHTRKYGDAQNFWREYIEENEAWVWAEMECHRLGIRFDYEYAEDAIDRYRRDFKFRISVGPIWRYYEEGPRKSEKKS